MKITKLAVIGLGNWGKNITRVCHELNLLYAVCDTDVTKTQKYAEEYNVKSISWQEALANKDITAVAIAVPAPLHVQYITEALHANKHVFVEKPLAMDMKEAQGLCILADRVNRILMVGHILQYHTAYLKLKELIAAKEIGEIRYIESTRLHMGPIRYDTGIIWELLPHDVSMLLGICNQTLENLTVYQQKIFNNSSNYSFGDVINVNLSFSDGILARIYSSWLHARKEQKFWVAGTKGMLVFEDTENWDNKLRLYKYNDANSQSITSEQKISLTPLEPLKAELNQFVSSIQNGSKPTSDGYEGVRVVKLLQEIENKLRVNTQVENTNKEVNII